MIAFGSGCCCCCCLLLTSPANLKLIDSPVQDTTAGADDLLLPETAPVLAPQAPVQRTTGSRALSPDYGRQAADSSKAGIADYMDTVLSSFLAAELPDAAWLTPPPDGPLGARAASSFCSRSLGLRAQALAGSVRCQRSSPVLVLAPS